MGKILTKDDIAKERLIGLTSQQIGYIKGMISKHDNNFAEVVMEEIRYESALLRVELYLETKNWDKLMLSCFMVCQNRMATPKVFINAINQMHEIRDKLSENFVDDNKRFCNLCIEWLNEVKKKPFTKNKECNEIINVLYKEVQDESERNG